MIAQKRSSSMKPDAADDPEPLERSTRGRAGPGRRRRSSEYASVPPGWHASPMDEMTPSPRRAGRLWVTPKAEGMLEGAAGEPGATEDEKLLERTAERRLARDRPVADAADPGRVRRGLRRHGQGRPRGHRLRVGPDRASTTRCTPWPERSAGAWPRPATRSSPAAGRARWRRPTGAVGRVAGCRSAATSSCRTSRG